MNSLTKILEDENENKINGYQCQIEVNKNKLKFKAYFEDVEAEEDEENEDNLEEEINNLNLDMEENEEENNYNKDINGISKKCCCIKFELFKSNDWEYLLRFVRESGEKDEFYKILKNISSYIRKI